MMERITAEWLTRPATQAVFTALRKAGFETRAVGGAVRNTLLGAKTTDVDLATTARPEEAMAAAQRAGLTVIPTGLQHGTVTVISNHIAFEVTTLRRDVETDGRHAIVAFTDDWTLDASRRDFTLNALYCDGDGVVHDPLNGLADLKARRVRFIGDAHARIREDYLRILRFFRFTAEYAAGRPDAAGLTACGDLRDGLQRLSAERVRGEILKLLTAPRAADVADVMFTHGYWPSLLGLVVRPQQLQRLAHLDRVLDRPPNSAQRLATLAIETTEDAERLALRLKLSSDTRDTLKAGARISPRLKPDLDTTAVQLLLYREGKQRVRVACAVAEARWPGDWQSLTEAIETLAVPLLPVRGQDLIDRGIAAGPAVGHTMRQLEQRWIDSGFTATRDALLATLGD